MDIDNSIWSAQGEALDFAHWPLSEEIKLSLQAQEITTPTEVQSQCWDKLLQGHDLLVQSQTGSGKTLAFALPILYKLALQEWQEAQTGKALRRTDASVKVLVVLPTRELAMQVAHEFEMLHQPVALLFGGAPYQGQYKSLAAGVPVVIGTPGRICDHIDRGSLKLKNCRTLVLDEADELLDLGFADELNRIVDMLPAQRQSLLFSATLPQATQDLAARTLRDPEKVSVSTGLAVAEDIRHYAYEVRYENRKEALSNILHIENPRAAIVFCHTRAETEEIADYLAAAGFEAAALHGEMAQNERIRTLHSFRRAQLRCLVATDVAARGIDVRSVTHVINVAVPRLAETYVHRVGRTGRAGDKGIAITLVSPRDGGRFAAMLRAAKVELHMRELPQGEDVRRNLRNSLHQSMCDELASGVDPFFETLADELLGYLEPRDVVSVLLSHNSRARAILYAGQDVPVPVKKQPKPQSEHQPKDQSLDQFKSHPKVHSQGRPKNLSKGLSKGRPQSGFKPGSAKRAGKGFQERSSQAPRFQNKVQGRLSGKGNSKYHQGEPGRVRSSCGRGRHLQH